MFGINVEIGWKLMTTILVGLILFLAIRDTRRKGK